MCSVGFFNNSAFQFLSMKPLSFSGGELTANRRSVMGIKVEDDVYNMTMVIVAMVQ